MPDPITIAVPGVPGEAAIVGITAVIQKVLEMNSAVWQAATPTAREKLADQLLDSNLRALKIWDRLLDFLHVPKV